MIAHTAYFGDGVKTFTLTDPMIEELQHKSDLGIGALFLRMAASQFRVADVVEIIRLGLIGGGTSPADAQRLVHTYAKDRPFDETFPLALDILDARWNGKQDEPANDFGSQDETRQAAASGDLATAISAAYEGVE